MFIFIAHMFLTYVYCIRNSDFTLLYDMLLYVSFTYHIHIYHMFLNSRRKQKNWNRNLWQIKSLMVNPPEPLMEVISLPVTLNMMGLSPKSPKPAQVKLGLLILLVALTQTIQLLGRTISWGPCLDASYAPAFSSRRPGTSPAHGFYITSNT